MKGADPARIISAVSALSRRLAAARGALGTGTGDAELVAAAGALSVGVSPSILVRIRDANGGSSVATPLVESVRIINPSDQQQEVPPIHAQLHDSKGKVVYSWTIPPPARTIPAGGSTSFNSAELNIPPTAEELTVTLGEPKA